jgi:hypothetical protein
MKGNVVQCEGNVMALEDVPDRNSERRPRKLNQLKHGAYMTEGMKDFKVVERAFFSLVRRVMYCTERDMLHQGEVSRFRMVGESV